MNGTAVRIDAAQERTLTQLYRAGKSLPVIGKACGRSHTWVSCAVKKLGLSPRPRPQRPRRSPRMRKITAAQKRASASLSAYKKEARARVWTPESGWTEVRVVDDGRGSRRIVKVRS